MGSDSFIYFAYGTAEDAAMLRFDMKLQLYIDTSKCFGNAPHTLITFFGINFLINCRHPVRLMKDAKWEGNESMGC